MKIHALTKRVGCVPRSVWISNSLSALQKKVDGYIEAVTLPFSPWARTDLVLLCNEEGRLRELPYNCTVCGVDFVGDLVFVGRDGDEFCDLPCDYQTMKLLFPQLWAKTVNPSNLHGRLIQGFGERVDVSNPYLHDYNDLPD